MEAIKTTLDQCCVTVMGVLTEMLGSLVERGV